jgi:transposase
MHGVRLLRLYRQEVAVMVFGTDAARNRDGRWCSTPWTVETARWQEIDQALPADHLVRLIRTFVQSLDLSALRRSYLGVGKPAFPPELTLMVVLYEMQRGQLHPCRWAEDCKDADPVKWLAMGLHPSAAYFYGFRQRLGPSVESWNQQLIRHALANGATQASAAAVDGSFMAALGSRHRLLQAKTLAQRCQALRRALADDARAARAVAARSGANGPGAAECPRLRPAASPAPARTVLGPQRSEASPPYWMAQTPRGRGRQWYRYRQAQQRLDELLAQHGQRENRKAKRKRRRADQVRICPSEPEAALGRDKFKTFRPLYNVQLTSDVDTPLILDYGVYATNTDAGLFIPTLQRLPSQLGHMPEKVLVDGIYATAANLAYSEQHGVTLYAPADDRAAGTMSGTAKAKYLSKEQFRWHAAEKTYYCPEGHPLLQIGCKTEKREQDQEVLVYQYRCPPHHCQACHRAAECTQAPHKGRTIKRSEHEEKVDALRQRMQTPQAQALYKKRGQSVEPRFGDLKAHRGLRSFAAFGRTLALVQVGLLVLMHNALYLFSGRQANVRSATAAGIAPDELCPPPLLPAPSAEAAAPGAGAAGHHAAHISQAPT